MDDSGGQAKADLNRRVAREVCAQVRCRRCGAAFARESVIVLGQRQQTWLVAVVCEICRLQGLVFAHLQPGPRPHVLTELSPDEAEWFALQPTISLTDVRALRQALETLEGDISQLWQ